MVSMCAAESELCLLLNWMIATMLKMSVMEGIQRWAVACQMARAQSKVEAVGDGQSSSVMGAVYLEIAVVMAGAKRSMRIDALVGLMCTTRY